MKPRIAARRHVLASTASSSPPVQDKARCHPISYLTTSISPTDIHQIKAISKTKTPRYAFAVFSSCPNAIHPSILFPSHLANAHDYAQTSRYSPPKYPVKSHQKACLSLAGGPICDVRPQSPSTPLPIPLILTRCQPKIYPEQWSAPTQFSA